jgi:hypothetical protein
MRRVRGVGAVAVAAAAGVVLAGCGGGSDEGSAGTPSTAVSVSEVASSAPVPEVTEPEYPPGPAGEVDRKADEEGWTVDELYASASEFVDDICVSLPDQGEGGSRGQWLAESGNLDGDGKAVLTFGVPKMCPKWAATVRDAVSGHYDRWIGLGDFEVVSDPAPYDPEAEADVQQIGPGTYEASGRFKDCYWERTSQGGDIIANRFVTQARKIRVTLRVGELFKNDCGPFKPVG